MGPLPLCERVTAMENDVMIRPAAPEDAETLYAINRDAMGYDYPLEQTRQRLNAVLSSACDKLFVAELNGLVSGYVHAANYDCIYAPSLKNILALAVLPQAQGRHVGRRLLGAAEQWAKECGCSGVRLVSGFNRMGAHGFYLACGYTDRKNQKNFIKLF